MPASLAEQGAASAGCRPGLRCKALALSSGLSHAGDEITEVPAHDESESRIRPNIWTSLAPRGAGGKASQPASSLPRDHF